MSGETGIRDLLTGLYTRDYFDEVIGRELERSRRHKIDLSVLSVVLVNKASLAASAGEETADAAVVEAARTLLVNLRETDSVFRWEDDEFIALLFDANAEACAKKVQLLASLFRPWRDGQGPIPHPVKIRMGAATHETDVVFAAVLQAARAAARNQTVT